MFTDKELIVSILTKSYLEGFSSLNLSYCDLREIPFFLLERPILTKQKMEEGCEQEGYIDLELHKVKNLNLSNNYLTQIDTKISCFKNVETLDISNNKLEQLPRQLTDLGHLKTLIAHDNPLVRLPQKMASLHALEVLDLSNTIIYELPSSIQYLYNLKKLNISNCKISVLPKELFYLPNLESIDITGNPLIDPPIEIAAKGIDYVRCYYEEIELSTEKDFLYEVKLLLIGEERAGKTTIAEALSNPDFEFDLYKESTQGIDIRKWMISRDKLDIGKDFQVNIWDFGGQEIYHATHQFFFTKRSLYFLVTEARKDLRHDDLFYWLNLIEVLGNNSPVTILINKSDQPYTFFATDTYREKFPNILGTKNISCLPTHRNTVGELKETVYSILSNKALMPDVGVELPKVWIDIRNELNRIKDVGAFYITQARYFSICKKYNMNEERSLFLSDYFHDLGVFLHFQNDLVLRETIFLNFEWVTNAVYCVLDNPKIVSSHGFFDDSDLDVIWKKNNYQDKKLELLTLMKNEKFEVCFELEKGKYLAPQLLHPDKIPFSFNKDQDIYSVEYRYEFMPKGIISRFIVKQHEMIYNKMYWKHGVILSYKSTMALVEEKYFESPKKISIRIQGKETKEMFSLIRKTIDGINSSFSNISVYEMVQCNCLSCIESINPNFYNLKELQSRLKNKRYLIECNNPPYIKVSIPQLVNDIISDINFLDIPSIPDDYENYEQNKISKELSQTQDDLASIKSAFAKEKEQIDLAKKLLKEIESTKIELTKLNDIKNDLDALAIKKTKVVGIYYFIITLSTLIFWVGMIYYYSWDKMEQYTYLFGVAFVVANGYYFYKRGRNLSHEEIWNSKLESQTKIIYRKHKFSVKEYEQVRQHYEEIVMRYKKLMK